jgi:hypothetical protein
VHTPVPQVRLLEGPQGATMPSHDLPVLDGPAEGGGKSRIAWRMQPWLFVVVVVAAAAAGFVMGFLAGRAT